jgi:hypothetical protein
MALVNFRQGLEQFGQLWANNMKEIVKANGNNNTGLLVNSITYKIVETQNGKLRVTPDMLPYGYALNSGAERRAGKQPPIKAIQFWIAKNDIRPEGKITPKQLPFVIARGIGKKGVVDKRAFPFIMPAANKTLAQFEAIVGPAIIKDFQQTIKVR